MIKEIALNGRKIEYNLQYKKVKNINLRIMPDGSIYVSADSRVPQEFIDAFLLSKADFLLKALDKCANTKTTPRVQYFKEDEVCNVILELCKKIYPYFCELGVKFPVIRFKRMVSQWGNCHSKKGILTFNTNLMYAPIECIEYVIAHEFTHFLQPNHSDKFYYELAKIMPDWHVRRQKLKGIVIK